MDFEKINEQAERSALQRKQDWRQAVVSQHSVHANLTGMQVAALTIFIGFSISSFNVIQKTLFGLAIGMILIQTVCLIFIAEHERQNAYSPKSDKGNEKENKLRLTLNWSSVFSTTFISGLLIYSVLL